MILNLRIPPLCMFLHHFLISNTDRAQVINQTAFLLSQRQILAGNHIAPHFTTAFSFICSHRRQAGLQIGIGIFPRVTTRAAEIMGFIVGQAIIITRSVRRRRKLETVLATGRIPARNSNR